MILYTFFQVFLLCVFKQPKELVCDLISAALHNQVQRMIVSLRGREETGSESQIIGELQFCSLVGIMLIMSPAFSKMETVFILNSTIRGDFWPWHTWIFITNGTMFKWGFIDWITAFCATQTLTLQKKYTKGYGTCMNKLFFCCECKIIEQVRQSQNIIRFDQRILYFLTKTLLKGIFSTLSKTVASNVYTKVSSSLFLRQPTQKNTWKTTTLCMLTVLSLAL